MDKISFSGMTPSVIKDVEELFDVMRDDYEQYLAISKETFEHNEPEDNLVFKYKYIIDACYCEGDWFYSLELVVLPEYLCQSKKESVASCCCIDVEEINVEDVKDYGATILMGSDKTEGEDIDYNMINCIASVFECVNSMRGFYLDRYQGFTNGWDLLDDYINDKDAFKTAMDRISVK